VRGLQAAYQPETEEASEVEQCDASDGEYEGEGGDEEGQEEQLGRPPADGDGDAGR